MHVTRDSDGLSIDLASAEDTTRLGRAIALLAGPGVVIGLVGPLGPAKPTWRGQSPKRSGSIPRRFRAPPSS